MAFLNQLCSRTLQGVVCLSGIVAPGFISAQTLSPTQSPYTLFESAQVRPLALSKDSRRLFAVNTPDNHLEVFDTSGKQLRHCGSIAVGLEPVAVALRNSSEAWVINHLSDSVSIVKLNKNACQHRGKAKVKSIGYIRRTLQVADEPRDIVFAGKNNRYAFITTAHRGQNAPFDPQLTTPGVGRADVWVFDTRARGSRAQKPVNIINLFTNTPRALAVSPDGKKVYAAGFNTGNKTTTLNERVVTENGGLPEPTINFEGIAQPETGLIVKHNGENWLDETGRIWDNHVKFNLPDYDVFTIDATANPPALSTKGHTYSGVGSTLFNMAVNPRSGHVYVSNLNAQNAHRFEGPGIFAGSTVRGNFTRNRISILDNGDVKSRHLNKHIDYTAACCEPLPNDTNDRSLALPMGMAISQNGKTLYVTAFGSQKVGVFKTEELLQDSFIPDDEHHIELSGGGPSGIVLDEKRDRAYVLTRFDNAISVIDLDEADEIQHHAMVNPEPAHIISGRRFLYDARYTSSRGDSACASCHISGDIDYLAWDLGNPDGSMINNPGPIVVRPSSVGFPHVSEHFLPMKGPMTTQSLRGMANHGPLHWRGDRTGGNDEPSFQPDSGVYNEHLAFKKFNVAFEGLLGRSEPLTDEEMHAFTSFALELMYPPNPIRNLDNSLTASQQAGKDYFFNNLADPFASCAGCHITDPAGNAEFGVDKPGFFGADGRGTFELEPQIFKIPHLRNMYQKVGMFGMARTDGFILPESDNPLIRNAYMGDQVNGFGYLHDGSVDTVFRFLNIVFFEHAESGPFPNPGGFALGEAGDITRRQVEDYVFAFENNFAPVVGQQVTVNRRSLASAMPRIELLMERAEIGECDLVVKQYSRHRELGYLYTGNNVFKADTTSRSQTSLRRLLASLKKSKGMTFTCAPPASGERMALDRDLDGVLNGDHVDIKH